MTPSFPDAFVLKLLRQDASLINAFRRLVEKILTRTEQQLRESKGIHLEPIKSNHPYQSIRLDRGPRAKVLIEGTTMVFLDIDQDLQETLYLLSIPGLRKDLLKGKKSSLASCIGEADLKWS